MTQKPPSYSEAWLGNDGKTMWRTVSYWIGFGYQTFLQRKPEGGVWEGY